ncbi:MAG: hypothetical protein RBQ87_01290 [Candidatus Cloacimonadaceae bacterium]|jgi:hypothetical protein|nr:hypothetical protein [Candidatus Cloacimonadaceae bacterium]
MSTDSDLDKMSPRCEKVIIGIREIEELEIWPLSMADQLDMSKMFDAALSAIIAGSSDDLTFVMSVRKAIEDNLGGFLQMITDYDSDAKVKKLMKKITNDQFVEICEKVFLMNFERISKNVVSLLDRLNISALGRLLPAPLNDTQDMESNISQDFPSEKEG